MKIMILLIVMIKLICNLLKFIFCFKKMGSIVKNCINVNVFRLMNKINSRKYLFWYGDVFVFLFFCFCVSFFVIFFFLGVRNCYKIIVVVR